MTLLTQTVNSVSVSNRFDIGSGRPFTLIAGPCVIESERMIMQVAENLKQVCLDLGIHLIFKSSFIKPIVRRWILLAVLVWTKVYVFCKK